MYEVRGTGHDASPMARSADAQGDPSILVSPTEVSLFTGRWSLDLSKWYKERARSGKWMVARVGCPRARVYYVVIISIYTSFVVIRYRLIASWHVLARFTLFISPFAISSDKGVSCIVFTVGAIRFRTLEKRERE